MSIQVAETSRPKKGPKVLKNLEVHAQLGGGHIVKHIYSGYEHEPRDYKFGKDEGGRAMAHIARHAGLPMEEGGEGSVANEEEE